MTSAADANLIQLLSYTSEQLNRYLSSIIFTFGTVGNILNCLVLSQHTLRSNPCAVLFLASSFVDLISILIGLPTRILAGWNLDPTTTINWICKLRAFVVYSTRTMAIWLITLATIDRWLVSCVDIHRRQMSTLKNVQRGTITIIILSLICYSHMLYCYEANIFDAPLKCYGKTQQCRLTIDIIYAVVSIVIPFILIIIFGLMTISNVHHIHTRVQNVDNETGIIHPTDQKQLRLRKTNHHLLRMLLVQTILLILLYTPQTIQNFYVSFQPFGSISELNDAIVAFLYNITLLLTFIASGMPFYIYTLAGGSIFRKAFFDLMQLIVQKITC